MTGQTEKWSMHRAVRSGNPSRWTWRNEAAIAERAESRLTGRAASIQRGCAASISRIIRHHNAASAASAVAPSAGLRGPSDTPPAR